MINHDKKIQTQNRVLDSIDELKNVKLKRVFKTSFNREAKKAGRSCKATLVLATDEDASAISDFWDTISSRVVVMLQAPMRKGSEERMFKNYEGKYIVLYSLNELRIAQRKGMDLIEKTSLNIRKIDDVDKLKALQAQIEEQLAALQM